MCFNIILTYAYISHVVCAVYIIPSYNNMQLPAASRIKINRLHKVIITFYFTLTWFLKKEHFVLCILYSVSVQHSSWDSEFSRATGYRLDGLAKSDDANHNKGKEFSSQTSLRSDLKITPGNYRMKEKQKTAILTLRTWFRKCKIEVRNVYPWK
jgi:hypothetical protein